MKTLKSMIGLLTVATILSSCSKDPQYFLTKITVTSFPEMQGSIPWDDNGGEQADVFPAVKGSGGVNFWELQNYQTSHLEDATLADLPYSWAIAGAEMDAATQYTFELWDYDIVTANELMGTARLTLEDHDLTSGSHDIAISGSNIALTITIEVEE